MQLVSTIRCLARQMTDSQTHPAKYLKQMLEQNQLTYYKASEMIGLSPQHLHMVAHGQRGFTVEVACRLERAGLGTAIEWLELQARHDLCQWYEKHPKETL